MTTQDKLAQALRDGLDAAEARLQERQSSLAGYPYKWRVEQESVDNLRAVLAEYESAHSAPAAPAVEPWQPIETAPKDGRTLLLGRYNEAGNWRTMRGAWMSAEYIAENWEDPDSGEPGWHETSVEADDAPNCWAITPTHWMPLPAAPGAQPAPAQQPDNWRQYATEREGTAQQVIERHRGEHDSLLRLLAKDRTTIAELKAAQQAEPFGYFRAEPFGWTDCSKDDEGAIALYERPQAATALQAPLKHHR
jgi:hypothetical protein